MAEVTSLSSASAKRKVLNPPQDGCWENTVALLEFPLRILFVFDFQGDLKNTATDMEDGLRRVFARDPQSRGVPVTVDCVACAYEAIQTWEKNAYDALVLGPGLPLSKDDTINAVDFIQTIAHVLDCASEPLGPMLVVMNQNDVLCEEIPARMRCLSAKIKEHVVLVHANTTTGILESLRNALFRDITATSPTSDDYVGPINGAVAQAFLDLSDGTKGMGTTETQTQKPVKLFAEPSNGTKGTGTTETQTQKPVKLFGQQQLPVADKKAYSFSVPPVPPIPPKRPIPPAPPVAPSVLHVPPVPPVPPTFLVAPPVVRLPPVPLPPRPPVLSVPSVPLCCPCGTSPSLSQTMPVLDMLSEPTTTMVPLRRDDSIEIESIKKAKMITLDNTAEI